jgi:ribonuclease D
LVDVTPAAASTGEAEPDGSPAPTPLLDPREGVPPVVEGPHSLREAAAAIAAGTGPVAIDAERASGYRYGQRAYLIQLRREGAGTHLVDPIAVPDLGVLAEALEGTEWILHAASQDLPCLRELDLRPSALFDTELAGRLLGFPRVGLSSLLEDVLGYSLAKEHSAADWSTRPLPEPWLRYAALDVELLVELRDALETALREAGKLEWAMQEFEAVRLAPPAAPRVDPWRRTSGMHKVRKPRQLAVVRALWERRDAIARRRDTSPGRVLPDAAIVAAALGATTPEGLAALPAYAGRGARRHLGEWQAALAEAVALPDSALPPTTLAPDGPPPPRAWADRDPDAAARLTVTRAALTELAAELALPLENLVSPDLVRRIDWNPPAGGDEAAVAEALRAGGARPWQVERVAPVIADGLSATAADLAAAAALVAEADDRVAEPTPD